MTDADVIFCFAVGFLTGWFLHRFLLKRREQKLQIRLARERQELVHAAKGFQFIRRNTEREAAKARKA